MREPHGWLHRRYERFGDVFSSRFPFYGRVVYLAEPQLAKDLLTGDPSCGTRARPRPACSSRCWAATRC